MPTSKHFSLGAFICLLVGGSALGFTGIFTRSVDVGPVASAFWRFALAAPFLWIWALASEKEDRLQGRWIDLHKVLIFAGLYFAADTFLYHQSLFYTTVANATLLLNLAPVVIAFIIWKVHHTKFAKIFLIGMVVALVGAAGLLGASFKNGGTGLFGDFLGLMSAGIHAAYLLIVKAARLHYSSARMMAWISTISGLVLLPIALLLPGRFFPQDFVHWLPLFGLAFVSQILGQTMVAYASHHLPVALSSISLLVMPLVGAGAAWVLLGQALSWVQIGGGVLLLVGLFLTTRGYRHQNPPPS
jgi:drug/metabolite transporter (DMT)-like permease